jgi:hypothetical protein
MTDEAIVEVIGQWLWDKGRTRTSEVEPHAEGLLAALEAAGYAIYRPEDCEQVEVEDEIPLITMNRNAARPADGPFCLTVDWEVGEAWLETYLPDGTYRLVPVGGDS